MGKLATITNQATGKLVMRVFFADSPDEPCPPDALRRNPGDQYTMSRADGFPETADVVYQDIEWLQEKKQ